MLKPKLYLLKLPSFPVFKQLQLEEALLRTNQQNWCLFNKESSPAIVMGISGKPDKLINQTHFEKNPVPVIRRFSGGGTVFVNEETFFTTFICNSEELKVPCSPEAIFKWSEKVYQPVFEGTGFKLQENDYVIGDKKFGGNAQYLTKNRWLHHTSLLFDFNENQMNCLSFPERVPSYRRKREHSEFLCKLKNYFSSKEHLEERMEISLKLFFEVQEVKLSEIKYLLEKPHRKSTTFIKC